jgi:hypothetical protein
LELSFNYQKASKCTVRLALEPVGPHAGEHPDLLNEYEARALVNRIAELNRGINLQGFDFFDKETVLHNDDLSPLKEKLKWGAQLSQRLSNHTLPHG